MIRILITTFFALCASSAAAQQNSLPNQTNSFSQWGAAMVAAYSCEAASKDADMSEGVVRTWALMRSAMIYANRILPSSLPALEREAAQIYSRAGTSIMTEICFKYLRERSFDEHMGVNRVFWSDGGRMDSYYRYFHANYVCVLYFDLLIKTRQEDKYQALLDRFLEGEGQRFHFYDLGVDQQWSAIDDMRRIHDNLLNTRDIRALRGGPGGRHEFYSQQLLNLGLFYPGFDWLGEYTVSEDMLENLWNMFESCTRFSQLQVN